MSRVDEARRLLTIDGLLQMAVKKRILHVKLMNGPAAGGGDAEDDTNGGRFDNRTERLVVVDAVALSEAADHPAGLVTGEGAIGVEFMLINPLSRHNVGTWRSGYKAPPRAGAAEAQGETLAQGAEARGSRNLRYHVER